ncbi:MAG TPA: ribonuclease E/G [Kiloniellales bacterium]|nr:ribonuclease E/G [Kiloniellales bacterium]
MSGRLLLSLLPGEERVLRVDEEGQLQWIRILRGDRPGAGGDLVLGRVMTLDPGLNAAFVEIGLERPGLLPLKRKRQALREGQAVVVRLSRAPSEEKGARLSLLPEHPIPPDAAPPRLLASGDDPFETLRAEAAPPEEIVIDDLATYTRARQTLKDRADLLAALRLHAGPGPLLDEGLQAEILQLLQPLVPLPGGGNLLIEPVRTLTAIDVNAGRHKGSGAGRALEVNLEAAHALARQLRLRDLSGRILIDFLEMEGRRQREQLAAFLKEELAEDPEAVQLLPPRGQLFELTRRRRRPPLHELLARRCGLGGSGWERDPTALAYELLRQVAGLPATAKVQLLLAREVEAALLGPAAAARAAVEARRGSKLAWQAEAGRHPDESEIVLG